MNINTINNEIFKIKKEYQLRDANQSTLKLYSNYDLSTVYIRHEIERYLIKFFNQINISNEIKNLKILDVGCGGGTYFNLFLQLGFENDNIFGVELLYDRIVRATLLHKNKIVNANACFLPFNDNTFDFVVHFTLLSSITNYYMRKQIASEMVRVTKNNGYIISYDMNYVNPFNKNLLSLTYKDLKRLFGNVIACYKIILNPIILRKVVDYKLVCDILSKMTFLNAFNLAFIKICK